jgi:hypothetical protein
MERLNVLASPVATEDKIMSRTTMKQLEGAVERLNIETGNAITPYSMVGGKYKPNGGNYHLDGAFGGWQLVRMSDTSSGISNIMPRRGTKSDCWDCIQTVLAVLQREGEM